MKEDDINTAHPAWKQFLQEHTPALNNFDCQEALTTDQLLEKLNSIAHDDSYSSVLLLNDLRRHKFKSITLEGTDTLVWLIKSTKLPVSFN